MNLLETLNYYNLDYKFPRPSFEGPFGTDKELWGYVSLFYNDFFEQFKDKEMKFVEIGTMYGGSLMLWEKYFTKSQIIGIELKSYHQFNLPQIGVEYGTFTDETFQDYLDNSDRITFFESDAYDKNFIEENFEDESIDILIDDGPHTMHFQKLVCDLYSHKIKKGGYIIVEDIIQEDLDELLSYYKNNFSNFEIELAFNESYKKQPWNHSYDFDRSRFNIVTLKKINK